MYASKEEDLSGIGSAMMILEKPGKKLVYNGYKGHETIK